MVARLLSMDTDFPKFAPFFPLLPRQPLTAVPSLDLSPESVVLFGRKKACTVYINDPTVSGTHCKIYHDGPLEAGCPWTPGWFALR